MFEGVNFTGFDDATIEQIKNDSLRFIDYEAPGEHVEISGERYGNSNTYHVMPLGRGDFYVQVCEPGKGQLAYKYAIAFVTENGVRRVMPIHHPMD